jgi:hypothetical protein
VSPMTASSKFQCIDGGMTYHSGGLAEHRFTPSPVVMPTLYPLWAPEGLRSSWLQHGKSGLAKSVRTLSQALMRLSGLFLRMLRTCDRFAGVGRDEAAQSTSSIPWQSLPITLDKDELSQPKSNAKTPSCGPTLRLVWNQLPAPGMRTKPRVMWLEFIVSGN